MRKLCLSFALGVIACLFGSTAALAVKPAALTSAWVRHSSGTYVFANYTWPQGSCNDGQTSCTYVAYFCDNQQVDGGEQFRLAFSTSPTTTFQDPPISMDLYKNKDADAAGVSPSHPISTTWYLTSDYVLNQIDWDLNLGQTLIGYIRLRNAGVNYTTYVFAELVDC